MFAVFSNEVGRGEIETPGATLAELKRLKLISLPAAASAREAWCLRKSVLLLSNGPLLHTLQSAVPAKPMTATESHF